MKMYRIEFSGREYPNYRPSMVKIFAPDQERAKEWAKKQLRAWFVEESHAKVRITEITPEALAAEAQPEGTEAGKSKKAKKREAKAAKAKDAQPDASKE